MLAASNTELTFDRATGRLLYDTEVREVRVALTRTFGEPWLLIATLGSATFDNGFLDSFVANFHHAFGLSNGDRGHLGNDGHTIGYDDGGSDRVALDRNLRAVTRLLIDFAVRAPAATNG